LWFKVFGGDPISIRCSDIRQEEDSEVESNCIDAKECDTGEKSGGFFHQGDIILTLGRKRKTVSNQSSVNAIHVFPRICEPARKSERVETLDWVCHKLLSEADAKIEVCHAVLDVTSDYILKL